MRRQDGLDRIAFREPTAGFRIVEQRLAAEQLTELGDGAHGQRQVAVRRPVDAVGCAEVGVRVVAGRALNLLAAVLEVHRQRFELEVDDRLEHADLDQTALSGHAPPDQAGENALHQVRAGEDIGDREAHGHRAVARVAAEPGQATERLQQQVLPGLVFPRPLLAVTGDHAVNDLRVDRLHALVVEPVFLHHARTEVVDQNVGGRDQTLQLLTVVGVFQLGLETLLVAVDRVENARLPVEFPVGNVQLPTDVAAAWALDLDHAGAQVGQPEARRRPGQELAEVQNRDVFQWPSGVLSHGSPHFPGGRSHRPLWAQRGH